MKTNYLIFFLVMSFVFILGCTKNSQTDSMKNMKVEKNGNVVQEDAEFKKICVGAGYEWMLMKPTKDGKIIQDAKSCMGCMVEEIEHICDMEKFIEYVKIEK